MVRRVPVPGAMVTEPDIHAAGPVVPRHEPPDAAVEVPARLNENVVHAFDDTVAVHPDVVAIAVRPVSIDPDATGALNLRLNDHDRLGRGRRVFGGCHRRRLLDHDDGLPIHFLGGSGLRLDHHVGAVAPAALDHHVLTVAVVRDLEAVVGRAPVAVGAFVVSERRRAEPQDGAERRNCRKPSKEFHGPSLRCMSVWLRRHPPGA